MSPRTTRALWLLAACLLAGCQCGLDTSAIDRLRCTAPFDCEEGLECRNGYCQIPQCDPACGQGQSCEEGRCVCDDRNLAACGSSCVRTTSDPDHCGGCGEECDEGAVCQAGVCQASCEEGFTNCDGSCVDLLHDRLFCGDCETACTGEEVCITGNCRACTQASECNDDIDCTDDDCVAGACVNSLRPAMCVEGTTCVAEGDSCSGDRVCAPCAGGCVEAPTRFTVTCDDGVSGGQPGICNIGLNQPTVSACITCTALAGMTEILREEFSGCDLSGWTVTGEQPICPLELGPLFPGTDDDALEGDDRTFSIEREVDTTDFDRVRLCFDYAQRASDGNQTFIVSIRTAADWEERFSDQDPIMATRSPTWITQCLDLDAAAGNNPALGIRFEMDVANDKDLYLDDVFVDGWVAADLTDQTLFEDDFTPCDPLEWDVEGDRPLCQADAGWPEPRDAATVVEMSSRISRHAGAPFCEDPWLDLSYGSSNADHGEGLLIEMDVGGAWAVAWGNDLGIGPDDTFTPMSLGLAHIDPAARDATNLGVLMDLHADGPGRAIAVDDIVLRARSCGPAGERVEVSDPGRVTDMAYSFAVSTDRQITVHPVCTWAGRPDVTAAGRTTFLRSGPQ